MRTRIHLWQRLFIAFAGLSILALATFAVLQQQGLRRGFLDYLNRLSLERVGDGARRLGERYDATGNWDFVRGRPGELMRILGLPPGPPGPPDRPERWGSGDRGGRPDEPVPADRGPPGNVPPDQPPPPPGPGEWPPPPGDQDRQPPPRPAGPLDLAARLLLVDADNHYVAGHPDVPVDSPSVPVMSHGAMVGRLLLAPMPKLRGDLDLSFARTQLDHALLMACAVLLGALLLSWWLARWLLAPIRALSAGSRALVAGHFATRVPATRSDELGALAEDFNQLASTLEKNRDARRRWGADIAHELRTPVGILRGEIQALQDGIRKIGPETLASLQTECDRLAGLVEDLYQLSLSDAGALAYRFETLDLGDLLRDLVQSHAGAMQDAGLELTLDASPMTNLPVQGDAQRLMQLFGNLLRNCIRYTRAPGKVRIAARRVGADCVVEIDDTAPGVPEASLAHLFDRLYRVESSRSRESGGAGLGLAICRNIALAHGGNIVAASSSMGGLCIGLRLPLAGSSP